MPRTRQSTKQLGKTGTAPPMEADAFLKAPAFIVHDLAEARAALEAAREAGTPVRLESAPDAAGFAGAGWFAAMIAAAREAVPGVRSLAVLDCGRSAGAALGAIRDGAEAVRSRARPAIRARLAVLCREQNTAFFSGLARNACNLGGAAKADTAARDFLAPGGVRRPRPEAREKARG